jgi:UDP-glucose 4-epimerase
MRVVTTGAAGFIGSTLVDRLVREGHHVLAVDDLSNGRLDNLAESIHDPRLAFLEGDVLVEAVCAEMAGYRGEVFIHLAAEMDVRYSVADPIANARNNVLGLLAVIDSARTCGARKVVFASSGGTIYGDQERYPVDESARVDPLSPYGASKVCGEIYLQVYRHLHRLQTTALALGNVYGPRQDPNGEAGVVSIFASALLEGRQTVIYGDGSATRDFVYVDDVVEAFVLATGTAGDGLRLNIGTGHETSVRTLHRFIADAAERPDRPTFLPARSGELDRVGLDSTAARRVLGWQSRQGLADGIARTVAWLRDRSAEAAAHAAETAVQAAEATTPPQTTTAASSAPSVNLRGVGPRVKTAGVRRS